MPSRRRRVKIISAVAVSVACSHFGFARPADYQKGLNLALFSQTIDSRALDFTLDNAVANGVDHVSIDAWWFQDNINSTSIAPNFSKYSASDATIEQVIDAAHSRGISVELRPLVDLANDPAHWRGDIVGGANWFTNANGYNAYIDHMATIAQQKNVELFSVGAELETVQTQESSWRNLISGVRADYSGKLVYAANWGNPAIGNTINWWDAIDYVGIDAYYPLTGISNPTRAQLDSAWVTRTGQIQSWHDTTVPNKQILFTEAGYQSIDGTNETPYGASGAVDMDEQADCYEALLAATTGKSWFSGIYWWATDPNNLHPGPDDYSSLAKPAADVMASYYVPGYTIGGNWTGAGGGNFNTPSSWSNNAAPGAKSAVTFNGSGGGNTLINLGGGSVSLARITFDTSSAASYTFASGGTISFVSGGGITVTNTVTTTQTINSAIQLNGPTIFANWSTTAGQKLNINGAINSANAGLTRLAMYGNGNGLINGNISDGAGTISLFKAGDGTWTIGGNNSFTGETYVATGNLALTSANALGSTLGGTVVASGASVQVAGNVSVGAEPLQITGVGNGGQGALQLLDGGNPGTFGGAITVVGNSKIANRSFNQSKTAVFNLTGKITGGGAGTTLTLWGSNSAPGFFRLSAAGSDFVGTTYVLGTKLILSGGDNALSPNSVLDLDTNNISASLDPGVLDLNGTNQTVAGLFDPGRAVQPRVVNRASGTLRTLTINSSSTFGFNGTILDDVGQIALAKTGSGNQYLTASNTFSGGTTVSGGTLTFGNTSAAGTGTLTVNSGRAVLSAGLGSATRLRAVNVSGDGALDVNDNRLIVGFETPRSTLENLIRTARGTGAWDQNGITSSIAKADPHRSTTLGLVSGTEYFSLYSAGALFGGKSVANGDSLIRYTYYGDANFSGIVDGGDYARIDSSFNNEISSGNIGGWLNGDFNYDGTIDGADYALIDAAFNSQLGTLGRALAMLSGNDAGAGEIANSPGLAVVAEHEQLFGGSYADLFISSVPEPCLALLFFAGMPVLARVRSRFRR